MTRLLPMLDPFDEIRRLYFSTTRETIERDIARATELLTRMPSDAARERVAGFMHGLADLRREWKTAPPHRRDGAASKKAGAGKASGAGASNRRAKAPRGDR